MSIFGIRERRQKAFETNVLSTLTSDEGRKAIVSDIETKEGRAAVLSAFVRDEVDAAVQEILRGLSADLLAVVTKAVDEAKTRFEGVMQSEKQRNIGALTDEAKKVSARCVEELQDRARNVYETLDARLTKTVNERLLQYGEALVSEAVATYVRGRPAIYPGWSNRDIAAEQGISIREVKRRRRADRLQGSRRG